MDVNKMALYFGLITSLLTGIIGLLLYLRMKKSRFDQKTNSVVLESFRDSVERQMYILNDRLVRSEERWLDVNHLLIGNKISDPTTSFKSRRVYYSEFLKSNGIFENDLVVDEKFIFILTPFNDLYRKEYVAIRDICQQAGFTCMRGDEKQISGDIFPEMLKYIVKARLVIANINGRNPNVLYELGIAHALDKNILLLSSEVGNLPVDLKSKKFIIYESLSSLQEKIREELYNILT